MLARIAAAVTDGAVRDEACAALLRFRRALPALREDPTGEDAVNDAAHDSATDDSGAEEETS